MNLENANELMHKGILALARAERQGIRIDLKYAQKKKKKLTVLIDLLDKDFKKTNFYKYWEHTQGKKLNTNSNYQLAHYLYKVKKIKPLKLTASGQGSVDEEALEALQIPELDGFLRIRKLKKLRDTYLHSFLNESVGGYIHPVFNLHTTATYRSSSDSPNFQNIPVRDEESKKIIRTCLFPRPGHQLLEIDYGSLEVCIAACYHKDPTMIQYIKDQYDMHADMAQQIFCLDDFDKKSKTMKKLRYATKNGFVFPQFYGDYYGNNVGTLSKESKLPIKGKYKDDDGLELPSGIYLGEHLRNKGVTSFDDFTGHLRNIEHDFWSNRFPVYARWKKRWWKSYQKKGYFDTLTGFRCSGIMHANSVINYPVQGSAFHCLLWSFIEIDKIIRKKKLNTRLIGQIHDSILLDVHPSELNFILEMTQRVTCEDLLEAWDWIIVPLRVEAELCDVDESWYHKEEISLG